MLDGAKTSIWCTLCHLFDKVSQMLHSVTSCNCQVKALLDLQGDLHLPIKGQCLDIQYVRIEQGLWVFSDSWPLRVKMLVLQKICEELFEDKLSSVKQQVKTGWVILSNIWEVFDITRQWPLLYLLLPAGHVECDVVTGLQSCLCHVIDFDIWWIHGFKLTGVLLF